MHYILLVVVAILLLYAGYVYMVLSRKAYLLSAMVSLKRSIRNDSFQHLKRLCRRSVGSHVTTTFHSQEGKCIVRGQC